MSEPHSETRLVQIAPLGERLSALRLCDATALATVRRSLVQHGQLSALTLFTAGDGLEIIDGFKRVRAARALGWRRCLRGSTTWDRSTPSCACASCTTGGGSPSSKKGGSYARFIVRMASRSR